MVEKSLTIRQPPIHGNGKRRVGNWLLKRVCQSLHLKLRIYIKFPITDGLLLIVLVKVALYATSTPRF